MRRHIAGHTLQLLAPGSWAVEGTPYAIVTSDRARQDGRGTLKGKSWWEAVDTSQQNLIVEGTTALTLTEAADLLARRYGDAANQRSP